MIRRKTIAAGTAEMPAADRTVEEILRHVRPAWAEAYRSGRLERLETGDLDRMLIYLGNVYRNLRLFVPARQAEYGISERGGDAILGYLKNPDSGGSYFFFSDVSGFTALLTFLTDRFGKEEAGDIMNLSILNRYCLNKMGIILDHFRKEPAEGDRGLTALKVMFSIRAAMPLITREVRRELREKLAGKPHQEKIQAFIDELVVKASGGLVFDPEARSGFYGQRVRARITWGNTGKLAAGAEKVGGSDDPVAEDVPEVKGTGIDEHCYGKLAELADGRWLGLEMADLAVSGLQKKYHKVVIRDSGMEKLSPFVEDLCSRIRIRSDFTDLLTPEIAGLDLEGKKGKLDGLVGQFQEVERSLSGRQLLLHVARNLGPKGNKNVLLDESCSAVRDSGVLFCNFVLADPGLLDNLADQVHRVMLNYGIHYKYNIFPKGDFNLMGVLGTMFSEKRGMDRYYSEVLWNTWRDLKRELETSFGDRVQIRGGMSIGKALQGPAGDNLINNEETIIGPDCNLAARLVNEAMETDKKGRFVYPSGTLFTIGSHRRKLEHLIHPEPAVKKAGLKGFRKPVNIYRLEERGEVESIREFIARLRRVPLVTVEGRVVAGEASMRKDSFLAECLDVVAGVSSRKALKAQMISFVAESGVGKTRRIAELARWALDKGWPVYFGECYSWYQGETPGAETVAEAPAEEAHTDEGAYPYYPFIRILKEQVFRINNVDPAGVKRDKIAQVLARLGSGGPQVVEQAPVIASFIGVEVPETGFSAALDPEARRNIFYERVGDIFAAELARLGKGGVLFLCIDDLQWADRNSLHLLSYLIGRVGAGLVVCVNARQEEQLGLLLDEQIPVERHVLKPGLLKTKAIVSLARLVMGIEAGKSKGDVPVEIREKLEKELESNPFFIIEFCNKMIEQELITVVDGRCLRFDAENFRNITIPTKIQGVIEDRISRLPRTELSAIQYSSVLGNILRYIIIRQFLPAVDTDNLFADSSLEEIFEHLTGQEITRLENEKDPDWVYAFKRALIGEKLYQELVPSLRKRLHREVAGVFEKTDLANSFEKALLTALHFSNAEVPDKSCEHYLEAGRLAKDVFDNEKSLLLFDRIEKILDEYKVSRSLERKMTMLDDRGQVKLLLGKYDEALKDFGDLAGLAAAAGDNETRAGACYNEGCTCFQRAGEGDYRRALEHFAEAAGLTADQGRLAEILNDKARTHLELGEREQALALLEQAEEAFTRSIESRDLVPEDRIFFASLMRNRGSVLHRQGKFKEAIGIYREALGQVEDEQENKFKKIRALILNSIGLSLMKSFKLDEAMPYFEQALSLARSIGDLKTEVMIRNNMAVVANDQGRNQEALDMLSEQLYALQMLVGETRELAGLMFNIGESHVFMENFSEAEPWYRRALDIARKIGYKQFEVGTSYNLGEVLHHLGNHQEALEVLQPAYELAGKGGWDLQRMDLANLLGEIQRELGDYKAARQFHEQALELSRVLDDVFGMGWALRNVAVDILQDPGSAGEQVEACAAMLEDSVKLTREAGQPENLMYSLRELIRYRLERRSDTSEEVRKLYRELRELAGKTGSKQFGDFCDSVAGKLSD
ncbi:MAG: tetratricopeptide repeat protein [Candidatus Glassbacteria bacterium]|nr:tetratricopeptide repeat protein [Candidatus Glassbacteria bacterium]